MRSYETRRDDGSLPLQLEMACKPARHWAGQQHMIGFFHDEPGGGNRMDDAFDRGHSASPKRGTFHNRGIHPLYAVQLPLGASPCVEES